MKTDTKTWRQHDIDEDMRRLDRERRAESGERRAESGGRRGRGRGGMEAVTLTQYAVRYCVGVADVSVVCVCGEEADLNTNCLNKGCQNDCMDIISTVKRMIETEREGERQTFFCARS